ncbi:MAG: GNAT family N-acetyltransferase [Acholeplasmataceae bacterium]
MQRLETNRLVLRGLELRDLEDFYHYARKPEIGPRAGWKPHESIGESLMILARMIKNDEVWAITIKGEDRLIGTIGLHQRDQRNEKVREIGYVLDDTYWNRGIVTEAVRRVIAHAFQDLGMERIRCGHHPDNGASRRVIEKCGFVYTHDEIRKRSDGREETIVMYEIRGEEDVRTTHEIRR